MPQKFDSQKVNIHLQKLASSRPPQGDMQASSLGGAYHRKGMEELAYNKQIYVCAFALTILEQLGRWAGGDRLLEQAGVQGCGTVTSYTTSITGADPAAGHLHTDATQPKLSTSSASGTGLLLEYR